MGRAAPGLAVLMALALPLAAQSGAGPATPLGAWRAALAHDSAGVWIASNATWRDEDGGTERYGLDWSVSPGESAGTGCLWGERDGDVTVHWRFHRLWDPLAERGLVYQISPAGAIATGSMDPLHPELELIQTLVQPGGARLEIRHLQTSEGADVHLDRSFHRTAPDQPWQEARSYRWERRHDVPSPCGAGR